jgi:hypothetical protein
MGANGTVSLSLPASLLVVQVLPFANALCLPDLRLVEERLAVVVDDDLHSRAGSKGSMSVTARSAERYDDNLGCVYVHEAGCLEETPVGDVGIDVLQEVVDVAHAQTQEIIDRALTKHHAWCAHGHEAE